MLLFYDKRKPSTSKMFASENKYNLDNWGIYYIRSNF